jgi:hypothetical protein
VGGDRAALREPSSTASRSSSRSCGCDVRLSDDGKLAYETARRYGLGRDAVLGGAGLRLNLRPFLGQPIPIGLYLGYPLKKEGRTTTRSSFQFTFGMRSYKGPSGPFSSSPLPLPSRSPSRSPFPLPLPLPLPFRIVPFPYSAHPGLSV